MNEDFKKTCYENATKLQKRMMELADELRLNNVSIVGAKWGDSMYAELQACRFVVVPSLWHENFPYVINQSFAFGKAVIGANRGGIPELVAHGQRGLIYEAVKIEALVDAIRDLWTSPDKVKTMGRNAKMFADNQFNDKRFFQSLEEIYKEVLS